MVSVIHNLIGDSATPHALRVTLGELGGVTHCRNEQIIVAQPDRGHACWGDVPKQANIKKLLSVLYTVNTHYT